MDKSNRNIGKVMHYKVDMLMSILFSEPTQRRYYHVKCQNYAPSLLLKVINIITILVSTCNTFPPAILIKCVAMIINHKIY